MAIKAGDLIQIAYKRRNVTGFKTPVEYLVQQVPTGKSFIIVNNGFYTTTLDLDGIKKLVKSGKARVSILSKNEKGGYNRMARMSDEIKEKFIAHFMAQGINSDSMLTAVRTFQLSLARVKAYIETFELYDKLGIEKPAGRQKRQSSAPTEEAANTSQDPAEEQMKVHEMKKHSAGSIGDRIRELRESLGLTQEKFGARVKLSQAHISSLEASKDNPSDMLIRLMHWEFGVSEDWLIYGIGPMFYENSKPSASNQPESIHHSVASAIRRLVPTTLKGNIANYKLAADKVIIYNRQNDSMFVDLKKDELPDLIMELDELLSLLGENDGITI